MKKRNFKFICLIIAVFMMLSTMPFNVCAVGEVADDNVINSVCGDDCAEHDEHKEEPGGKNILCIFGHSWEEQRYTTDYTIINVARPNFCQQDIWEYDLWKYCTRNGCNAAQKLGSQREIINWYVHYVFINNVCTDCGYRR